MKRTANLILIGLMILASLAGSLNFVSEKASAYETHPPIVIIGDAGFNATNGVSGGDGSAGKPWIIENFEISASNSHGISITSTTKYFVIWNVSITSDMSLNKAGIFFDNVGNGTIDNCTISGGDRGIWLQSSKNNTVANNTLSINNNNIKLSFSSKNEFHNNTIYMAASQYGFHFDDEMSYDNFINATAPNQNTVNDVTVRWYTNQDLIAPIENIEVNLTKITNIAQIMLYNCSNLFLNDSYAGYGDFSEGVYLYKCTNVSIFNSTMNSNNNGVKMHSSSNITIGGNRTLIVSNNNAGIYSSALSGYIYVSNVTVEGNELRGIHIDSSGTILNLCQIQNNTISDNIGGGLYINNAVSNEIDNNNFMNNSFMNNSYGINIQTATYSNVTNNSVGWNNGGGISIISSNENLVFNNAISYNTGGGLYINSAVTNEVHNNTLMNNGYGIKSQSATYANVTNNSVEWNNGDGIYIQSLTKNFVYNNSIANNTGGGLYIQGGNINIINKTNIKHNLYGIYIFDSSQTEILNGNVSSNNYYGVNISSPSVLSDVLINNNNISDNGDGLIWGAGLRLNNIDNGMVENNILCNNTQNVHLNNSVLNEFMDNTMWIDVSKSQYGFYFNELEEISYNNIIRESNTVNTIPVRWYRLIVGTEASPEIHDAIDVELRGITNVAQIMYYKCANISLTNTNVNSGTNAGIYLYSSSTSQLINNDVKNNIEYGVRLKSTLSTNVSNNKISNSTYGIYLEDSSFCQIQSNEALNTSCAVNILDSGSKNNIINGTNASGASFISVYDPSNPVVSNTSKNIICDAGLDKVSLPGQIVTFDDNIGISNSPLALPITYQKWDFGDGATKDNSTDGPFHPNNTYDFSGTTFYVATYSVTIGGITYSDSVMVLLLPGIPLNLTAVPGDSEIQLTWDSPTSEGYSSIINYVIYRRDTTGNLNQITVDGSMNAYLDTILTNNRTYYYQIVAINNEGQGEKSAEVFATPIGPPSAPRNLYVSGQDNQINLSWAKPSDDGGSPITNYNIYRGDIPGFIPNVANNTATVGNVLSYTDSNLPHGITYYYIVTANNSVGEGVASNLDTDSTPVIQPSTPQNVTATGYDGYVNLTWLAPADDGGTPIINYTIYRGTVSDGIKFFLVKLGDLTTYNDTAVINGQTYYYAVSALNIIGEGQRSDEVNATPIGAPLAPQSFQATGHDGYVNLTWDIPSSDGGYNITNYFIYRGTEPGNETLLIILGNVLNYTDSGVTNGQIYYYFINVNNSFGVSLNSTEQSTVPFGSPSAPQNLQASLINDNTQAYLTWSPPAEDGGSPVINYILYYRQSNGWVIIMENNVLNYTHTLGNNGRIYYYKVSASNSIGEGNASDNVTVETPAYAPSVPLNPLATSGDEYVNLTWIKPSDDGGDSITNYSIYRNSTSGAKELLATITPVNGNGLYYVDSNLTNGVTYYYIIRAVNTVGESLNSIEISALPRGVPSAAENLQVIAGDGYVQLSWEPPMDDGGSQITGYNIYKGISLDDMRALTSVTDLTFNDTQVTNGYTYYYVIRAINDVGEGAELSSTENGITPIGQEKERDSGAFIIIIILLLIIIIIAYLLLAKMKGLPPFESKKKEVRTKNKKIDERVERLRDTYTAAYEEGNITEEMYEKAIRKLEENGFHEK